MMYVESRMYHEAVTLDLNLVAQKPECCGYGLVFFGTNLDPGMSMHLQCKES